MALNVVWSGLFTYTVIIVLIFLSFLQLSLIPGNDLETCFVGGAGFQHISLLLPFHEMCVRAIQPLL